MLSTILLCTSLAIIPFVLLWGLRAWAIVFLGFALVGLAGLAMGWLNLIIYFLGIAVALYGLWRTGLVRRDPGSIKA